MKWPFSFKKKTDEVLERYQALRKIGRELNLSLVKQLPKAAVPECGKKLGLIKAGTLILNNDDEIAILYDYCLHHYRRASKNAIERHLEQSQPPADSAEMLVLQAMVNSYHGVFRVEKILPNRGAILHDQMRDRQISLMDIGLSETGMPGIILTGRILPFADFHMSSGTMIPMTEAVYAEKIKPIIYKFLQHNTTDDRLSPSQAASFAAQIIRVSLQAGGEDNSFYTDIER
ncbi:MAG: hypothetical protein PHE55_02390 [Methylococcaceae bacterium]|nr:hypothetical protein [Methylococcaceae bacterium]